MTIQLALFPESTTPSTSALGLLVVLPQACGGCGAATGVVGSSAGPHHARIVCGQCGKFLRWLPAADFNFIAEVIDLSGRPSAPIILRKSNIENGD
jgi:hypothetical protein